MQIQVHRVGDITVLLPTGRITRDGGVTLRMAATEAMQGGSAKLLCNFKDVTYIDSAGIADLVSARATVTNTGGTIKLCNVSPWVSQVLTLTQMTQVFDIFDAESEALASFS